MKVRKGMGGLKRGGEKGEEGRGGKGEMREGIGDQEICEGDGDGGK